jgi:hypothetical protein
MVHRYRTFVKSPGRHRPLAAGPPLQRVTDRTRHRKQLAHHGRTDGGLTPPRCVVTLRPPPSHGRLTRRGCPRHESGPGAGESLLGPAGAAHGARTPGPGCLVVPQVSSPEPWDARFAGPHPAGPG